MTGIYFSGTGNTKHCIEKFVTALSLRTPSTTAICLNLCGILLWKTKISGKENIFLSSVLWVYSAVTVLDSRLETAVRKMTAGKPPQNGLNFFSHLAGLLGQRLWFYNITRHFSDKLKIHEEYCIKCSKCAAVCPMHNLTLTEDRVTTAGKCTMCYRCVNSCPQKAITLIGKKIL